MSADGVRVRFEYDIESRKNSNMHVDDFDGCETFDELMDELREQAPNVEWSVHPDEENARELWALIEKRRAQG